jgi:outer membrane lipoprotein SlyB
MTRHALMFGLSMMTLSGCVSQSQWTPTVDTYGDSRAQFVTQDTQECRQLAMQVSGSSTTQAGEGALFGGLLGAASGAAIGAAAGGGRGAGLGAAIGAATGGFGGGAYRGVQSYEPFQRAFKQCMRNRGHTVLG